MLMQETVNTEVPLTPPRTAGWSGPLLDLLGVLLWIGLVGWVVTTARTPDAAAPIRDLLLLAGGTYVFARLVSRLHSWVVPAVVASAVSVVAVWHLGGILGATATDPLGYANASAALYVVGCTASLMVYLRTARREIWAAALFGASVCAIVPWLDTAIAAGLLMLPLPVAVLSREIGLRVRTVVALSAAAAVLVIGATVAVGAVWASGTPVDVVVSHTLSGNRAQLWREALDLTEESPLYGVGVNRFAAESPLARADDDLRWAHNEYLQLAAESGLPGFALAVGLLLWGFARLAVGRRDQATAVAAVGLAAASITASIDYVWHFPVVLVAIAAVVGSGGGAPRRRSASGTAARRREPRVDAALARDAVWPQQLADRRDEDPHVEQH